MSEPRGTEHGVGDGVTYGVAVAVRVAMHLRRNIDAPEAHRAARRETMRVVADADAMRRARHAGAHAACVTRPDSGAMIE